MQDFGNKVLKIETSRQEKILDYVARDLMVLLLSATIHTQHLL